LLGDDDIASITTNVDDIAERASRAAQLDPFSFLLLGDDDIASVTTNVDAEVTGGVVVEVVVLLLLLSCPAECGLRLPYLKFLSLRHSYCASSSASYSFTMTLMLGASSWRPQPTSLLAFSAVAPASSVSEEYSFVVDVVIVYIDALRSIVICLLDLHDACHEYFSCR